MNKKDLSITWLASYPRSGSAWARYLFAVYALNQEAEWRDRGSEFIGIHRMLSAGRKKWKAKKKAVEGKTAKKGASGKEAKSGKSRYALIKALKKRNKIPQTEYRIKDLGVKTHIKWSSKHPWQGKTRRAIHLIRHPRDVLVSCLNFDKGKGVKIESEQEWIRQFIQQGGVPRFKRRYGNWLEHYESWQRVKDSYPVHLVRYEDLKLDTLSEFIRMLEFLEIPIDETRARFAVEQSSIESMKKKEDEMRMRRKIRMQDGHRHVRSGDTDQTLSQFNLETDDCFDELFNSAFGSALKITGYLK